MQCSGVQVLTIDDPLASNVPEEQKFSTSSSSRAMLSRDIHNCIWGVCPGLDLASSLGDAMHISEGELAKALEQVSRIVLWM